MFQEEVATVSFHEMSSDCRIFVLSNALMKVSGCVPDVTCITQITGEMINNALPIHNGRLVFFGFKILYQLLAHKNRLQRRENLMAKITQLLPNRISGPLIFEWKTNSYCASTKKSLWFLMYSISKTKQSNFFWHFLKTLNCFSFKRWLLCTRHNLHRTDHMRNDKQRIADSQLTACFLWV